MSTIKVHKLCGKPNMEDYTNQSNVRRNVNIKAPDIIIASDADADGNHITGLFTAFMYKYFTDVINTGKYKKLVTPIAVGKNNKGKLIKWVYKFDEIKEIPDNLQIKYSKGLGSWSKAELQEIIEKEGFDKLAPSITVNDGDILIKWFTANGIDYRKHMLKTADAFDIMKL